ncbi:hypothetical protein [Enterobacter roggenkampii]
MSTITREFTKEQLKQIIETDHVQCGEASALARIALASLEAEAVGEVIEQQSGMMLDGLVISEKPTYRNIKGIHNMKMMPLGTKFYTAPPAPVVPAPTSNSSSAFEDFWSNFEHPFAEDDELKSFASEIYRAAMLQGADVSLTHEGKNHHEDKLGMVNHLGDVTEKVEPVTQIEPVADLYGLTSPTGGETSFTFDAVEARDFIDGGWSCQEYVELERFQEAVSGNSPVIQDGWVMVPVEPTEDMIVNGFESEPDESFSDEKEWEAYEAMSGCQQAAHRAKLCWAAMIAAAPKLE